MGASPTSQFAPMPGHAGTEAYLQESGTPCTSLRNGYYAATVAFLLGNAVETGELVAPEDGPVSWTAHADLAEAAAVALTDGGLDGITPALTADESIDLTGPAAIVAELTGRPIRRVVVPDDRYRDLLVERGAPVERAELLLGTFRASRAGELAAVDPTSARLLGRRPTPLREVLRAATGVPARQVAASCAVAASSPSSAHVRRSSSGEPVAVWV